MIIYYLNNSLICFQDDKFEPKLQNEPSYVQISNDPQYSQFKIDHKYITAATINSLKNIPSTSNGIELQSEQVINIYIISHMI